MAPPDRTKISVSLNDKAAQLLDDLADEGIGVSEAVRRALTVSQFVQEQIDAGAVVQIKHASGEVETVRFVFG